MFEHDILNDIDKPTGNDTDYIFNGDWYWCLICFNDLNLVTLLITMNDVNDVGLLTLFDLIIINNMIWYE